MGTICSEGPVRGHAIGMLWPLGPPAGLGLQWMGPPGRRAVKGETWVNNTIRWSNKSRPEPRFVVLTHDGEGCGMGCG